MKRLLYISFLLVGAMAYGQYYHIPYPNAGENPGNLNNDNTYPVGGGLPAGWNNILTGGNTSPAWSNPVNIPFTFAFNGTTESQFIVSSSGVLSFDVNTAVAAPSYTRGTLPSADIPDKSVCLWGLNSIASGDNVVTKTFGTAPNRQFWVLFNSYGYGTQQSDGQNYTYWSIMLEETTNNIYIVDCRTGGFASNKTVTAGVQIDATTAEVIAGSSDLTGLAGFDPSPADNSYYAFINGVQVQYDLSVAALTTPDFTTPGAVSITGDITNFGSETVSSFTINYEIDGGTTVSDVVTGVNIAPFDTYTFTHSTAYSATVGSHVIAAYATDINGNADENTANDILSKELSVVSQIIPKAIVIEEGTGTWCGWCPRGEVAMKYMYDTYGSTGQFIGIAVHNGDPMTVQEYDGNMGLTGYPGCNVDRSIRGASVSQDLFEQFFTERMDMISPASLDLTPTVSGNDVSIKTDATFFTNINNANMRLAVVIIEDSVTGSGSNYAQANYYSGGGQGAMGGYENLPNPVPAVDMVYDHVGRALLGGYNGQAGSVPTTITDGQVVSYTFNYTVPATSSLENMHAVVMLLDGQSGEIVHAKQTRLDGSQLGIASSQQLALNVYPNPASDVVNVEFEAKAQDYTVSILDMSGRVVASYDYTQLSGAQNLQISVQDITPGYYMMSISTQGVSTTKMLNIK